MKQTLNYTNMLLFLFNYKKKRKIDIFWPENEKKMVHEHEVSCTFQIQFVPDNFCVRKCFVKGNSV